MEIYVARQPIYDVNVKVSAYELLYRSGLENVFAHGDGDRASLELLVNSFIAIGIDRLSNRKPVHVNFTQRLLEDGVPSLFPPDLVVVEVVETTMPGPAVLSSLARLKEEGFTIALDDYTGQEHLKPLLEFTDIVKVDFLLTSCAERAAIPRSVAKKNVVFLAEKVETKDEFDAAVRYGYRLFQGHLLSRPEIAAGSDISPSSLASLHLIRTAYDPSVDFDGLASVISRDVSLSYRLLRVVNSVAVGLRYRVTSIRHALVIMGMQEIRRWIAVLAVTGLGAEKSRALAEAAVVRARMAELLAPHVGLAKRGPELFLTGLLSLMDVLLGHSMADVVGLLPLSDDTRAALLQGQGMLFPVLQLVIAYEGAHWEQVEAVSSALGIRTSLLPEVYAESLAWADGLTSI